LDVRVFLDVAQAHAEVVDQEREILKRLVEGYVGFP
jgi:hypothetical protein